MKSCSRGIRSSLNLDGQLRCLGYLPPKLGVSLKIANETQKNAIRNKIRLAFFVYTLDIHKATVKISRRYRKSIHRLFKNVNI